jgi:hypothetical protein
MTRKRDEARLQREFDRFERWLPGWLGGTLHWVRNPRAWWIRLPLGLLMIVSGFLGFLPVLGFWMLPLGLLLIALDVPLLQKPVASAIIRGRQKIRKWRRRA